MPCRAIWTIAHKDRLTLKKIPIRIVYRKGEELGATITGIIKPMLNLTLPTDPATVNPRSLAEALCCATRGSILEAIFNITTALALIIGSATGVPPLIALGLAGMLIALIQALAKLVKSRKGCKTTSEAQIVASTILRLAIGAMEAIASCSGECTILVTYGSQVYKISKIIQENRIEITLKPL